MTKSGHHLRFDLTTPVCPQSHYLDFCTGTPRPAAIARTYDRRRGDTLGISWPIAAAANDFHTHFTPSAHNESQAYCASIGGMMMVFEGFAEIEKNGWTSEDTTAGYVDLFSPASDQAVPAIISGIPNGARVLDLCCGQGNVTEALLQAGLDAVGADFSPKMLGFARRRVPDGNFVEADAQNLGFDDAEFDAVVCNFGLIHVPDQPRALAEIHRVLKPGGRFAMTAWSGPDVSPTFRIFYSSVQEHGDPGVAMPEGPNFHQFANEATARTLLGDADLAMQSHEIVDCYLNLNVPEDLAEIIQKGAPRGGYLLTQQPDENRIAIKTAVTEKVREQFADGDRWRAPIPAALVKSVAV